MRPTHHVWNDALERGQVMNPSSSTSTNRSSINIESKLDCLSCVRDFCAEIAKSIAPHDESQEFQHRLSLAVDEAVTNVIKHAYGYDSTQNVECRSTAGDQTLVFEILHDGKPFTPPETPVITEPAEGGMGLYLIEKCVDDVTYCLSPDGRQCIRLTLNLA